MPSHDVLPSHCLTLPSVVATHVEKPDQAVELDIEALDLRIPLTLGGTDDGDALAGEVGGAKSGMPAERDGFAIDGIDAVDNHGEGGFVFCAAMKISLVAKVGSPRGVKMKVLMLSDRSTKSEAQYLAQTSSV